MKRRPKGTGTFRQRRKNGKLTGRWSGQITVNGHEFNCSGASRAECESQCQAWAAEIRKHPAQLPTADVPLADYLLHWFEMIAPSVEPGTLQTYRWAASKLPESLLTTRLGRISRRQIQQILSALSRTLSSSSVYLVRAVLGRSLSDAVDHELIAVNPAAKQRIGRGETPEATAWSLEDCQAFLDVADTHQWRAIWWIVAATGLRNGEARALRWEDINRQTGEILIRRKWDEPGTVESQPKQHRIRTVAVDGYALQVLQAMPRQIGYLVTDDQNNHVAGRIIRQEFRTLLRQAGVPEIRFHGLRHTALTHLLNSDVPAHVVARIAGHSSPAITAKVYSHVMSGDIQRAAEAMAATLSTPRKKPATKPETA